MKRFAVVATLLIIVTGTYFLSGVRAQKAESPTSSVLGTYPETTVFEGRNTTVSPSEPPSGVVRYTARVRGQNSFNEFGGTVEADPVSGLVRITNARPAGTYTVKMTASGPDGTSTEEFTLRVITQKGCSPFVPASNFNQSNTPFIENGASHWFGGVADFDRDGIQDYAIATTGASSRISIYLGNGLGGFNSPSSLSVGDPRYIAIEDFNGDGIADIVAPTASGLHTWLGLGNGTFQSAITRTTVTGSWEVVAADFNNDGRHDIAVASDAASINGIAVHMGNGDGTFSDPVTISTAGISFTLTPGDFNEDGNDDLIAIGGASAYFLAGDGAGGFEPTPVGNTGINGSPTEMKAADFNNDGKLDFSISSGASGNNVGVFLGNGTGGFVPAPGSPFERDGLGGVLYHGGGDFDGDGNIDLIMSGLFSGNLSFLRGSNTGAMTWIGTLGGRRDIRFADLNGDGRQDIMVSGIGFTGVPGANLIFLSTCAVDVTTSSLPGGSLNQPYPGAIIAATGGIAPYTFTASGLPNGLSINPSTGQVSGTPTESGSFFPKFTVTDSTGGTPIQTFRVIPLTVSASANATVSGRVFDVATSTAARRIQVILADAAPGGTIRTAMTNSFGYYAFTDVPTGQNYVISISAKGYSFTPLNIAVNDNITLDLAVTATQ